MLELAVVIPVYNEEACIVSVLEKWVNELDRLGINYRIDAYNDGSKDNSLKVMREAEPRFGGRVRIHDKPNGGHGNTILTGYLAGCGEAEWIFQIDSDDEMGPESFSKLWEKREDYDFLVGRRDGRRQPLPRKVMSAVSRLTVRLFYGKSVWDVNTPYRLMRASAFAPIYRLIPLTTFAPNVIITGMAAKRRLRSFECPVPQRDRQTGEVSIKKWKLVKVSLKSFRQTIGFALLKSGK
ncbi:MAG: glycosyltransferase family 2 protein [Thermoguttaceae bacterium]|nr:glycosyltransferase family 2 protein [Thermoguttaceae bacterium]